jgi:hypothetical protein
MYSHACINVRVWRWCICGVRRDCISQQQRNSSVRMCVCEMYMFGVRAGEDFLSAKFQELSQFGNISFAYLDNYDWIWAVGLRAHVTRLRMLRSSVHAHSNKTPPSHPPNLHEPSTPPPPPLRLPMLPVSLPPSPPLYLPPSNRASPPLEKKTCLGNRENTLIATPCNFPP